MRFYRRKTIPYDLRVFAHPPGPLFERAWRHTARILKAMQEQAPGLGALFLVVGLPTKEQALPGYLEGRLSRYPQADMRFDPDYPNARLAAIVAQLEIPFLDLTPAFRREISRGESLFFDHDLHWNERGHRLAGQEIARFVAQQWTQTRSIARTG